MRVRNSDDPVVPTWALRLILVGAVLVMIGAATPQGAVATANVQYFLSFFAGVFTLIALTTSVIFGLLATDRLILQIRHRVLAQAVHRAAAVLALTMVVAHLLVKILGGLAQPLQAVVPGLNAIGLGTIAFELMVLVAVTGMLRPRFVSRGNPWMWRSMHAVAYLAWPIGILHGLTAGRSAANWVILSYLLSVVGVVLALIVRMIVVIKPRDVRRAGEDFGEREVARGRAGARDAVRARERAGAELREQELAATRASRGGRDPFDTRELFDDARNGGDARAPFDARDVPDPGRDPRNEPGDGRGAREGFRPRDPRATVTDGGGIPVIGPRGGDRLR